FASHRWHAKTLPKPKTTKLSVFKGREAKLNHAIFQTLAHKSPQTIYDIHKQIRKTRGLRYTRYASVNKRIKNLEETGYIKKAGARKTKVGFDATIYELTAKAYLVILLNSTSLEEMLTRLDEANAFELLGNIIRMIKS
ncbi:MAG: hypothetical protein QXZ70_08555, partial [Candidatus Bathyarchaeia archaeon]